MPLIKNRAPATIRIITIAKTPYNASLPPEEFDFDAPIEVVAATVLLPPTGTVVPTAAVVVGAAVEVVDVEVEVEVVEAVIVDTTSNFNVAGCTVTPELLPPRVIV